MRALLAFPFSGSISGEYLTTDQLLAPLNPFFRQLTGHNYNFTSESKELILANILVLGGRKRVKEKVNKNKKERKKKNSGLKGIVVWV